MKAWIPVVALGGLAAVGFAIAKSKTSGGRGTADVGGQIYRAKIDLGEGGWYALIFRDGTLEKQIGPLPSKEEAAVQGARYLGGLNVDRFYTVHTDSQGRWFFDGWSRGEAIALDQGPYASEAIANAAGSNWVDAESVGVGGCPSCEAKRRQREAMYRRAERG